MPAPRSDELDRAKVVTAVEEHFSVKLHTVSGRRKVFEDEAKKLYWVFTGTKDWHGFDQGMIQGVQQSNQDGVLVIATLAKSLIKVFIGSIGVLTGNLQRLTHTKKGAYQFDIEQKAGQLIITKIPWSPLSLLTKLSYSPEEKSSDNAKREFSKLFGKLSDEQKAFVMKQLKDPKS
jgi:hypothetical protein